MDRGSWHCSGGSDENHPQENKCKKAKWLSKEALEIAEKEEKLKEKKKREGITIWMQVSKKSKER